MQIFVLRNFGIFYLEKKTKYVTKNALKFGLPTPSPSDRRPSCFAYKIRNVKLCITFWFSSLNRRIGEECTEAANEQLLCLVVKHQQCSLKAAKQSSFHVVNETCKHLQINCLFIELHIEYPKMQT